MKHNYHHPVDQLLSIGDAKNKGKWMNYADLGFTREDIPELIRLATDGDIHWADENSQEVWGSLHAWRALGQLGAVEAIEPLVNQIDELDDDDWYSGELPTVLQMLGPKALDALNAYLTRSAQNRPAGLGYFPATEAVVKIGNKFLEARRKAIAMLSKLLTNYAEQDETFNAILIDSLLQLRARAELPIMAAAIQSNLVDSTMADWTSIQKDLRLPVDAKPADYIDSAP